MLLKILYTIVATAFWLMILCYVWTHTLDFPSWIKKYIPSKQELRPLDKKELTSSKNEKENEKSNKNYLTPLHRLFKTDFSHTLKISQPMFEIKDTNKKVEAQLHADFDGNSIFISLYIPSSPKTYQICEEMINHYDKVLEWKSKAVEIQTHWPGERPMELKDLRFTGRILIYHEYPIFESKLASLITLYKSKNLQPQFRGPDYSYGRKK